MIKIEPEYKWQEFSKKDLLIFALSGFFCALAFYSKYMGIISLVAICPAFVVINRNNFSTRALYTLGFARSYVFYFAVYSWFCKLYPLEFLGLGKFSSLCVVLAAMLIIPLLHSLIFAFAYVIMGKIRYCKPFCFACVWVVFEYIMSLGSLAFPWAKISIAVYGYTPFIQSANLFGNYFISFIVVLINALLALAYCNKGNPKKEKMYAWGALMVFVLNSLYGVVTMVCCNEQEAQKINVAIIQGNINSNQKWSHNATSVMLEKYSTIMNEANQNCKTKGIKPDLFVLPETAIPVSLDPTCNNLNDVGDFYTDFCRRNNVNMIVGAFYDTENTSYNSAFFVDNKGRIAKEPYSKRHLVPFGEYVPMRRVLEIIAPAFANMNAVGEDLGKGTDTNLAKSEFGNIGSLVCFDSVFESFARQSVKDGANVLCVITNDSWYKDSVALYQHKAHSVYRAVENRRYVLRAANTGISACISPQGLIQHTLGVNKDGYIIATVQALCGFTLYTMIGDIIIPICMMFVAFILLKSIKK